MKELTKKGEHLLQMAEELYQEEVVAPEEDKERTKESVSPISDICHLTNSLIYLGKLLNKIPRKEGETNQQLVSQWYEKLQEVDEDDSLPIVQKLQKSLDYLELILLGML